MKLKSQYILLAILILGFLLRIAGLDFQSIWLDEAYSIHVSQQTINEIIFLNDFTPPLYYLFLHFWRFIWGNSEEAIRSLSVVFGTICILAIYFVASRLLTKKTALLSALLFAISPINIYLSQTARVYSLLTLLSILSMYFYLNLIRNHSKKDIALYIVCNVFMVYSHIFAWFIILAQNIHFLTTKRSLFKRWILMQAGLILSFFPWIYFYFKVIQNSNPLWVPKPGIGSIKILLTNIFSGLDYSVLGLIFALLCLTIIFLSKIKNRLLHIWWIIPLVVPFSFSLFFIPIFTPKYILYISVPLIILLAHSLLKLKSQYVFAVIIITLLFVLNQQLSTNTDQWDKISEYVKEIRNDQTIVIINFYEAIPFTYHYDKDCFNEQHTFYCVSNKDRDCYNEDHIYFCSSKKEIITVDGITNIKNIDNKEIILILSRLDLNKDKKDILKFFDENYKELDSKIFSIEPRYENKIEVKTLTKIRA